MRRRLDRKPGFGRALNRLLSLGVALSSLGLVQCTEPMAAEQGVFGGLFTAVADVPLGPATSRFDYQSIDPTTGRLFVAEMGSAKLLVFNIRSQQLEAA